MISGQLLRADGASMAVGQESADYRRRGIQETI